MVPTVPNTPLNPPVDSTNTDKLPAFGKMDGRRLSAMVGLKVDTQNVVSSVVPGSPADVSGVRVGNKIPHIDALGDMGPVVGSSANVQIQSAQESTNVELVATDPTLVVKAEETLKAIEGLSRHLGQKGDWDGRVLCSFLRDNTRELLRICYASYKPAQQSKTIAVGGAGQGGAGKGPDLVEKVQLLEVRCAALTEHLQMQQEAIEDYQNRLNRYEKPGGTPTVNSQAELAAMEMQYEAAVAALKGELQRSQEEMDAFRASSDRIMKAQEQQVEQLRARSGGGEEEARLREQVKTMEKETEALRSVARQLGEELVEAKAAQVSAGGGELEEARRELAKAQEAQRMAEQVAEEYAKVPSGGTGQGGEEKRVMLAKVSLMEQAMGQCIDKMKQRQGEMEEEKEAYRAEMQGRLQAAEAAAKQRLDALEEEKRELEHRIDALQAQRATADEKAQLRRAQEEQFGVEERLREAEEELERERRDRAALRVELDKTMRAVQVETAERSRVTEEALAAARVRIDILEEEARAKEAEQQQQMGAVRTTTQEAFAAMAADIKKLQAEKEKVQREKEELRERYGGELGRLQEEAGRAGELGQQLAGAQTVIRRGLEEREKSKEQAGSLQQRVGELEREVQAKLRQIGLQKVQVRGLEAEVEALRGRAREGALSGEERRLGHAERQALMGALLPAMPNNALHLRIPCNPAGKLGEAERVAGKGAGDLGLVLGREEGGGEEGGAEGRVVVRAVRPGGAAAQSGLLGVGDEVITIEGELARGLPQHELEARLAGEAGTPVALFVLAVYPPERRRMLLVMQ